MSNEKITTWAKVWCGMALLGAGVGIGGLFTGMHSLAAVKTWEGRYYEINDKYEAAKAEIKRLNHDLQQANSGNLEMVFSVTSDECAKRTLARKNRNLLNLKTLPNGAKWEGQIGVDKFGHVIFEHPAYSVRAGAIIIKNYEKKHHIDTVEGLINRFCQSNRKEYIQHLCKALNVKPTTKISLTANLHKLIPAMIQFEMGEKVGLEYTAIIEAVKG